MKTPQNETIVVIGASPKERRYSNLAVRELTDAGYNVVAIGHNSGKIGAIPIVQQWPQGLMAHTVTIYLRPELQAAYDDILLSGLVRRVVFNPGTENDRLYHRLVEAGIEVHRQCTLVMLSRGVF